MARRRSGNGAAYDSQARENVDGSLQEETIREGATDGAEAEETGEKPLH
jgi:hypothetical protein